SAAVNAVDEILGRRATANEPALIAPDGGVTTFAALAATVQRTARALEEAGIAGSHDRIPRVGLCCADGGAYVVLALALLRTGACLVPIPTELAPRERVDLARRVALDRLGTAEPLPSPARPPPPRRASRPPSPPPPQRARWPAASKWTASPLASRTGLRRRPTSPSAPSQRSGPRSSASARGRPGGRRESCSRTRPCSSGSRRPSGRSASRAAIGSSGCSRWHTTSSPRSCCISGPARRFSSCRRVSPPTG